MPKLVCTEDARSVFGIPPVGFAYLPFQTASLPSIALIRLLKPLSIASCAVAVRYVLGTACRAVAPFAAPERMVARSLIVSCLPASASPTALASAAFPVSESVVSSSTVDPPPPPPVAEIVLPSAAIVILSPAMSLSCLVSAACLTSFIAATRLSSACVLRAARLPISSVVARSCTVTLHVFSESTTAAQHSVLL